MRARWRILSGAGAIGIGLSFWIIGQTREVSGDPSDSTPGVSSTPAGAGIPGEELRNPFEPYEPGTSGISYDQLSAIDKAGLDVIQEAAETAQPETSYQAFATATAWTSAYADKQLAARAVGLVGAADEGVVP